MHEHHRCRKRMSECLDFANIFVEVYLFRRCSFVIFFRSLVFAGIRKAKVQYCTGTMQIVVPVAKVPMSEEVAMTYVTHVSPPPPSPHRKTFALLNQRRIRVYIHINHGHSCHKVWTSNKEVWGVTLMLRTHPFPSGRDKCVSGKGFYRYIHFDEKNIYRRSPVVPDLSSMLVLFESHRLCAL